MRLFVAINFNSDIQRRIISIQKDLYERSKKGRFVPRDNLHLTLVFLGEVGEARVKLAQLCVKNIEAKPFTMKVNRLGKFKRPTGDLYWAGIQPNTNLDSIYKQLYDNFNSYEFYIKDAEYIPHLTLARDVLLKEGVDLEQYKEDFPQIDIEVNSIQLMKSHVEDGKLIYTPLYTKDL